MKIAVLALQGAFIEHEQMLQKLGVHTIELRQTSDLQKDFDGIILPGGESTVQGKLLHDLNMFEPLKEKIQSGIPVLATCAGMILLASDIAEQDETYFETITQNSSGTHTIALPQSNSGQWRATSPYNSRK